MTEPLPLQPKKEKDDAPKSSSEILSELFGVFNAKPPELTELADQIPVDDASKKRKKSKKKHKHKKKKKKKGTKRGRSSSDVSDSESDSEPAKKKSKKSKHKKHKHKKDEESESVSSSPTAPRSYWDDANGVKLEKSPEKEIIDVDNIKIEKSLKNGTNHHSSELDKMKEIPIPKMPDISQIKLPEEKKIVKTDSIEKSKTSTNKIQIKNLKFSTVFEANVKQAEEEARKKAEKYEDGELSDTSSTTNSPKIVSEESNSEIEPSKTSEPIEKPIKPCSDTKTEKPPTKSSSSEKRHAEKHSSEKSSRRSRSKSKTKSHKSSRKRSRSKSGSKPPERSRSRSRHKSKSDRSSSYSRSKSRHYYDRHDDRSRSHRHERRKSKDKDSRIDIDKKRLLEIARKNAITMLQTGTLPATANLGAQAQQNVIAAIKCGGKSVDELTDFCKNLSRQEAIGELSSVTSGSDGENGDGDGATKPFNNPFQIKDRAPIVLNIKGGTPLPTQSFQEKTLEQTKVLRQQFPVSSGSQHRGAENEWRPVSPPSTAPTNNTIKTNLDNNIGTIAKIADDKINSTANLLLSANPKPKVVQPPNVPAILPGPQVFPVDVPSNIDIGSIVSQRLTAIRKLQQNPNDTAAIDQMYIANQEMSKWAQSKQEPGQFTGSTGAQILTPKELASGYQAWARKDQLQTAAPVSSGMGMHLLQKMGWKPGEGLGKQKNGALTPLLLEVKLDTRGLVAKEETRQRPNMKKPYVPTVKTLSGKHPVSLLGEYCSKRKLGVPSYTLCFECGPDHKKNFLFKVTVNGIEYQPSVASANKKQAKADAATVCLQKLGIMP